MKLWNYIVLLLTMILFLEFVGMPTGVSLILDTFGININPTTTELVTADIENSTFFGWVLAGSGILVVLAGGSAIVVGLFARSYDTSLVILPALISVGTLFAGTFWLVIKYVSDAPGSTGWAVKLVAMIFVPLAAGFVWSCVEFFQRVD